MKRLLTWFSTRFFDYQQAIKTVLLITAQPPSNSVSMNRQSFCHLAPSATLSTLEKIQHTDPHFPSSVRFLFQSIFRGIITIRAVICGADGWVAVEAFGRAKYKWLASFWSYPKGFRRTTHLVECLSSLIRRNSRVISLSPLGAVLKEGGRARCSLLGCFSSSPRSTDWHSLVQPRAGMRSVAH